MRLILFIGIIVSLTSFDVLGQELACDNFKNGYFKIPKDETVKESFIERKGNKQTEFMVGKNEISSFQVEWTGACTYTLKPSKKTLKGLTNMPEDVKLIVEIIETNENSYTYRATLNFADFEVVTKAIRIDAAEFKENKKQLKR